MTSSFHCGRQWRINWEDKLLTTLFHGYYSWDRNGLKGVEREGFTIQRLTTHCGCFGPLIPTKATLMNRPYIMSGDSVFKVSKETIALSMHTCMHTNTYIHDTYTFTHTCTCMHTNMHTYMHSHINTHTFTNTYIHRLTYIHTNMPSHIYSQLHTYTYAHTCICTYMHTHTWAYIHTSTHPHIHKVCPYPQSGK